MITRIDEEEFEHVTLEFSGAIEGDARFLLFVAREEEEGTISDRGVPDGAQVSHLYRDGALFLANPEPSLRKGDKVVLVSHRKHLGRFRNRWAPKPGWGRH